MELALQVFRWHGTCFMFKIRILMVLRDPTNWANCLCSESMDCVVGDVVVRVRRI